MRRATRAWDCSCYFFFFLAVFFAFFAFFAFLAIVPSVVPDVESMQVMIDMHESRLHYN
jgi:hypothetical protein